MLHTIQSRYGDIEGHLVADLGVGCGILSIGASLLGCGHCVGVDCDPSALEVCRSNLEELEVSNIDLVLSDLTQCQPTHTNKPLVDTVIMNPPFGTKHNKGIDMTFVSHALTMCSGAVYSLHKSATRQHLQKKASDWGVEFEVIAQLRFDLPQTYRFHKQKSVDIEVDLVRFAHKQQKVKAKMVKKKKTGKKSEKKIEDETLEEGASALTLEDNVT